MNIHSCKNWMALACLAFCTAACVNDDPASLPKTNMTLQFTTRTASDPNAVEGEGMQRLEVYVVNKASHEIIRQWSGSFDETETKTITFADLTGGKAGAGTEYEVYAVANAPSGYDFRTDFNGGAAPSLQRTLSTSTALVDFGTEGIPMTAKQDVVLQDKDVALTLKVVRAVAKAQLRLTNHYGSDVTLTNLSFGRFFPTRTYLWGDGETVVMPTATDWTYNAYSKNLNNLVLKTNESNLVVPLGYFFESTGLTDVYTFTLNSTTMQEHTFTWNMYEQSGLNAVKRNQFLNINVTILKPSEVQISYEVTDWDERTVDVPAFQ